MTVVIHDSNTILLADSSLVPAPLPIPPDPARQASVKLEYKSKVVKKQTNKTRRQESEE